MKTTSYQYGGMLPGGLQNAGVPQSVNVSRKKNNRCSSYHKQNNQKKLPKKRLNYNPREIRNSLMLANKSQSAGRVVCQAKAKLSSLLKCKGTGMYNERELANAVIHARRMVYCAQMKNRNLKKEEQLQKRYAKQEEAEEQKQRREVKRKVQQKQHVLEQKLKMEKLQKMRRQKQHHEEVIRKRRMNRLAEKGKMDEADMEYQKNMDRDSQSDSAANYYAVCLPMDGVELELSEDVMGRTEEQLEQQAEMMIQAELNMMGITAAIPDLSCLAMPEAASGTTAEAVAVDIVV